METHILADDEIGKTLSDRLMAKQLQRIRVALLYDAIGSLETAAAFFERLRASGVNVCEFVSLLPGQQRSGWLDQRHHREQPVVNGRVTVSGAIHFSSDY